jgi:uncharacterized protein YbjT (DUF2867 family)
VRIAVAGATGNVGGLTTTALQRGHHDVVPISRSLGIDLLDGAALARALVGVDAVIDVTNGPAMEREATVAHFGTATRNLLSAEAEAGVSHHVLLSIAGIDRVEGNAHYAGKREQEAIVIEGRVPWSIVPATQFHDFPAMVARWSERNGVAGIAPLLMQPIAPSDVADVLAEVAVAKPWGRYVDIAGPDPQDFVDMARRTNAAWGRSIKLVPTWNAMFGLEMAGDVLLPGPDARIMPTGFEEWLRQQS